MLRNLGDSRRDMVNFANALSGLTKEEKLSLFRNHRMMLEWYEKVAPVTDLVIEYLQFVMKAGVFKPRTTNETEKGGNT